MSAEMLANTEMLAAAKAASLAPGVDTEEQAALREAVRAALGKHADSAAVRAAITAEHGYDPALWTLLAEQLGVAALGVPEEYGGAGASYLETHLVAEELGRTVAPSPFLGSAVLAAYTVLASGDGDSCAEHLPAIAGGTVYALAWASADTWFSPGVVAEDTAAGDTAAGDTAAEVTLSGTAEYVLGADYAETLLVLARSGSDAGGAAAGGAAGAGTGIGLFVLPADAAGVEIERQPVMDPTRTLARVHFAQAKARTVPTRAEFMQLVHAVAWAACAADAVGAAKELTARTVQYTAERTQFGRAIGSFQALKHRMADMYVRGETASSLAGAAAAAVARAFAEPTAQTAAAAEVEAAAAKAYATEALAWIAGEAIQLHGGVGITWEYDTHLYFKRAHGLATLFGQPHELIEALESTAGL